MTDTEWQILVNFGPLLAFLALWWALSRRIRGPQDKAVTVVAVNTEEMRRLTATLERLIDALNALDRGRERERDGDR